jgi:DNA helicase-2/ATP-dependent DNA helicase PcrA
MPKPNPAEIAAQETQSRIHECIDNGKSFLVEAGAGAGKTYSLIEALHHIITVRGRQLLRRRQQVACITYTNVARDEIEARTDSHPAILSSTIHAFCWSLLKGFQSALREELPDVHKWWTDALAEAGGIGQRSVGYDELGFRSISDTHAALHHDDVLRLTTRMLERPKFRRYVASLYPIILIDEYQDTDADVVEALKKHFLDSDAGPLMGFFGDHWQKIYGSGCGAITHERLEVIGKKANFRSVPTIVSCLNRMRPELPQDVTDPTSVGEVRIYHTNDWAGERQRGQHWAGDLPLEEGQKAVDGILASLSEEWDMAPRTTKILMLTHKALAARQGYRGIADVFPYSDSFLKKQDPHIAFFVDYLEPACEAFAAGKFGEMFAILGQRVPTMATHGEKAAWAKDMSDLIALRDVGKIGDVIEHLAHCYRPRLPEAVRQREETLRSTEEGSEDEPSSIARLRKLHGVAYSEVVALTRFIDEQTPFSTKHGVKGAEFENVVVIFGRGWSYYNFGQFLEWAALGVPGGKAEAYERNRNLFYVVCSRPRRRLVLFFTQLLSDRALETLGSWFGEDTIDQWTVE